MFIVLKTMCDVDIDVLVCVTTLNDDVKKRRHTLQALLDPQRVRSTCEKYTDIHILELQNGLEQNNDVLKLSFVAFIQSINHGKAIM